MDLDKCIKERFSCRKFKGKKPNYRDIIEAIEAATKAPYAGNIPTIKFILVSDKSKIDELAEASTQDFVASVHYIVVVCSNPNQCIRSYGERGKKYCEQESGAAIENFLLKITDLKLATCWVGAFADEQVKKILNLPEEIGPIALFPIGYAMEKGKQRTKPNIDNVLYFDVWKNKYMKSIPKPEAL